jgi:hypothetical protein
MCSPRLCEDFLDMSVDVVLTCHCVVSDHSAETLSKRYMTDDCVCNAALAAAHRQCFDLGVARIFWTCRWMWFSRIIVCVLGKNAEALSKRYVIDHCVHDAALTGLGVPRIC